MRMHRQPNGFRHTTEGAWPGPAVGGSLLSILLLCSCAHPARYVIVSEEAPDTTLANTGQRYICLKKEDARQHAAILALRTQSDIETYEKKSTGDRGPVEEVLYRMIRGDYARAGELLRQNGNQIPDYVRLVLRADLASEGQGDDAGTDRLVKMYQEAYDTQGCDISRDLIKLRIRQLRYRR
jgi:hypothetical protein